MGNSISDASSNTRLLIGTLIVLNTAVVGGLVYTSGEIKQLKLNNTKLEKSIIKEEN